MYSNLAMSILPPQPQQLVCQCYRVGSHYSLERFKNVTLQEICIKGQHAELEKRLLDDVGIFLNNHIVYEHSLSVNRDKRDF